MKIYYLLSDNKEILIDGPNRFDDNCLEMERENYHIKNGYNGRLFFEEYMQTDEYKEKASKWEEEIKIRSLRNQREKECFSIINRGELWYDRLTDEQKVELDEWYGAWLDLPNNYRSDVSTESQIPTKPSWLK